MKYFNLIFFLFPLLTNAQIFVDQNASGANDGTSWDNAYTDLQDAIQNANEGSEVWVAAGTYLPSPDGNVDSTFNLMHSVALYGGFSGTETDLLERDIEGNLTILSGDYNEDDNLVVNTDPLSLAYNNYSDNAKRIITAIDVAGSITIDGFTISGGNESNSGGAMLITPDVELTILIKNCVIKNNFANSTAGAIRVGASVDEVVHFRFENSSAINNFCGGAGLSKGGAVYLSGAGTIDATFTNLLFHQNFSNSRGGAANFDGNVVSVFENCVFSENQAANGGAIFQVINSGTTYKNCTFYKNVASDQASVIWNYSSGAESDKIQNCIFYNNGTNNPLYSTGSFGYDIGHTVIEYNSWADLAGSGNSTDLGGIQYNVNPMFVDEAAYDLSLSPGSPMINSGDNTGIQMTQDYTGYISRIVDGIVDLGAMEYHLPFTANAAGMRCFGENFGSASVTADNYPPFTYQWSDPTSQGANPSNLASDNNTVTVTNAIGDFEVLNFTLVVNPEINVTLNATDPTGGNANGTAMAVVSGGVAPYTYAWNTVPVQTTATATNLSDGVYNITITDANGCTSMASVNVGVTSAVQSVDDSNEIAIGPNPFNENVQIKLSGSLSESAALNQILIYNATGRLVYNNTFSSGSNTSIDLSQLSAGIYFMELTGQEGRFRKRLIKM